MSREKGGKENLLACPSPRSCRGESKTWFCTLGVHGFHGGGGGEGAATGETVITQVKCLLSVRHPTTGVCHSFLLSHTPFRWVSFSPTFACWKST